MKECPKCGKKYMDYDQYCLVCRYKLKYIEGTEKVEYCPEPHDTSYIKIPESKPTIKCSYCGSTNVKRISTTTKVINIAMFGLLGNKRKYQWHCNNCKSDF